MFLFDESRAWEFGGVEEGAHIGLKDWNEERNYDVIGLWRSLIIDTSGCGIF
jgi:hypothetical protein